MLWATGTEATCAAGDGQQEWVEPECQAQKQTPGRGHRKRRSEDGRVLPQLVQPGK